MREQMRSTDIGPKFDSVFGRYISNLPLYLDFKRDDREVEVFTCAVRIRPHSIWKSLLRHRLDITKSVSDNIREIAEKLVAFYPVLKEVNITYREPTVLELKEASTSTNVDELLDAQIEVREESLYRIDRVEVRRDRLYISKLDGAEVSGLPLVYRSKRPVSIVMAKILEESDPEKRFQIFSDNLVYIGSALNHWFRQNCTSLEERGDP